MGLGMDRKRDVDMSPPVINLCFDILLFKENVKVGNFIRKNEWCPDRTLRVDYIGEKRGMGTVFWKDEKENESVFTFEAYDNKYKLVDDPTKSLGKDK